MLSAEGRILRCWQSHAHHLVAWPTNRWYRRPALGEACSNGHREQAIARAMRLFDSGRFRDRLAGLVAIPSTSQDPAHMPDVQRYLADAIRPWLETGLHRRNPSQSARRLRPDPDRRTHGGPGMPTILTYGHGDTVRGLEDQWRAGLDPWTLTERGDLWYGRGTADNKGQHAVNLSALEAVLEERGGKLGFNVKLVLETSEERGSTGLREFVAANAESAGRRCADRQRRAARDARGSDDRHRHPRHLSFRSRGGPAAGRRAFRALGRADHGSGRHPGLRARHASSTATEKSWCATGCRETACRPTFARCWPAARSAAAARRRRSIRTGASLG